MKKYIIPVSWEMYGEVEIEAESLQEAISIVEDNDFGFPDEKHYVDGSFEINKDALEFEYPEEFKNK